MPPLPFRLLSLGVLLLVCLAAAADWPAFRGPQGTGISPEHGLPIKWGPKENVVWKTRLPGPGASSPILWGDRVIATCYTGYGDAASKTGDQSQLRRHLVCLDRASGKLLWQADVPAKLPEVDWTSQVRQHGYATSTPVTDGERIYVYFGRTGVLAFDFAGKELWRTEVGEMRNTFGSGASPVLFGNLLIVNATVESGRLWALDKTSGKMIWRVKYRDDGWSTPVRVEVPGGKPELVFNAPSMLQGLDPESGQELWHCDCPEPNNVSSSPVVRNGIVYFMGAGTRGRVFLAVRAGGRGDVTGTHVLWRQKIGAGYCSPVLVGDHLYFFSGLACCLRADKGTIVFQERLAGLGMEYPSPVAADGKIYLFTRGGNGYVLAAKDRLEVLANNDLGDYSGFVASPAISGGRLFVRSNEYLYCLGEKP